MGDFPEGTHAEFTIATAPYHQTGYRIQLAPSVNEWMDGGLFYGESPEVFEPGLLIGGENPRSMSGALPAGTRR
jgi:hypothetical protein